jgi:class 3 adenylate cyclase/tetratricopeptide (TPR) repeat protein
MNCADCGAENRPGAKFCVKCGTGLVHACPSCGAPCQQDDAFCAECGTPLGNGSPSPARQVATPEAPATERRVVSVLFADLVGFTGASERRDAEETRELLSRYFDLCRRLISLYGGTVEKFIGDAVMAVWGAPSANEDDAERAVRAALDLVAAVPELHRGLTARAGVLTGRAAVTIDATDEGMVAGDVVNTASRIQARAEPGTVLVGAATKRATEAVIAYESADQHELKGKSKPVAVHRALRVTAARGGALKAAGLEPPFAGRDRELRLLKERFHGCAEEGKAHLVSVIGIEGIGKSRLAWEFEKYLDGLADDFWWHRGRCLAYGEGVAYRALAEMVRMRAQILEEEAPEQAFAKLHAVIEQHVSDVEEQGWLEPRLAHLLGLAERTAPDREDLFSAWRLFFERLAETEPVVLVFEDLQWADNGLLDFVEYLLEWSRNHPVFVLALARPELTKRRPAFAAARRNTTTISLEPLQKPAMQKLLDGFVPGLPNELRARVLDHAEGVPLYAVETVRMLLDHGLLKRKGDGYRPTGKVEALDIPETLHALVSARLDGLSGDERRLLQNAAVLGKSFTKQGLAQLSGHSDAELEPLLAGLARKDVLSLQVDPRSPERGQYAFLQDLLRRVAYETLPKSKRKARHLAAAAYLLESYGAGKQEIVEVIAAHYVDAYGAEPGADDADEIRTQAREMLAKAGERAASLAANEEAQQYFERAAELATEPAGEAALRERAGRTAWAAGRTEQAQAHFGQALRLFEAAGASHPAARVAALLGEVEWQTGRLDHARERMERAFAVLSGDKPDADLATLAAELARAHHFGGNPAMAAERVDQAIEMAESLWLPEVLSQALNTEGLISGSGGRSEEALALLKHSLELALENDLIGPALRAYRNLGDLLAGRDRCQEAIEVQRRGVALARKVGNRLAEWGLLGELSYALLRTGRWDEALETAKSVPDEALPITITAANTLIEAATERGDSVEATRVLSLLGELEHSSNVQDRAAHAALSATTFRAEGRHEEALAAAQAALEATELLGSVVSDDGKIGFSEGLRAALALGRLEEAEALLARIQAIPIGKRPPFLRAENVRFRALVIAAHGEEEAVDQGFETAEALLREYGLVFHLAATQVEHAEWLAGAGRRADAKPLLAEARATFERLDVPPWLKRVRAAAAGQRPVAA